MKKLSAREAAERSLRQEVLDLTDDPLERMLVGHEDAQPWTYGDSKGIETIGIGRNVDYARGGPGLSPGEMLFLLRNDVVRVKQELTGRFEWYLSLGEARRRVLEGMNFQLGLTKLLKFKKMLAALAQKNFEAAADEMLDSKWARKDSPERAAKMAAVMRSGEWK